MRSEGGTPPWTENENANAKPCPIHKIFFAAKWEGRFFAIPFGGFMFASAGDARDWPADREQRGRYIGE
jgi:hypothetical protein